MTQHPLQFDPNRKENDIDSLSDTWSQADTLLEELPRARQRKDVRWSGDEAQSAENRGDSDAVNLSQSDGEASGADDKLSRVPGRARQGLVRRS